MMTAKETFSAIREMVATQCLLAAVVKKVFQVTMKLPSLV
jgi:hypothetical protein